MTSSDSLSPHRSDFRRIPYVFTYAMVNPRRSKVSIVPLSSVHTSHPLYPEFPPWLRLVRSSTERRGLRPHSKDSAEPPYTVLSQHDCTADIYEAYEVHLRYGLYACAHPRSRSGATFIRRCSRVSVTFHAYAIAPSFSHRRPRWLLFLRHLQPFPPPDPLHPIYATPHASRSPASATVIQR